LSRSETVVAYGLTMINIRFFGARLPAPSVAPAGAGGEGATDGGASLRAGEDTDGS
jgi:hypothetical protein